MLKLLLQSAVNWNYTTEPEKGSNDRAHPLAARQGARRLQLDQRHALCPRQPGRFRRLGADGLPRLELSTTCCPTSASRRTMCRAATPPARPGRPAEGRGLPHHPAADPPLRRSGAAGRPPFRKDLNGAEQEGVGYSQMTRRGRLRGSTARTFLAAARGRPICGSRPRRRRPAALRGQALRRRPFRRGGRTHEVRAAAR